MAFYQFQCEACDEITTVTQSHTYTTIGNKTHQKINPLERTRNLRSILLLEKGDFCGTIISKVDK